MAIDGDSALENVLNLIQSSVQTGLTKGEKVLKGVLGPAYEPVEGLAQLLTPDVPAIYEAGKEFVEKPSPAALTAVGMTAALESPMGKAGKAVDKTASSLDKSIKWFRGSNNPKELEGSFTIEKEGVLGGGGVYVTPNKEYAENFAKEDILGKPKEGGFVNELEVDFKNPLIVDITSNKPYPELELFKKLGYKEDKAIDIVEKAMEEKGGLTNEVKNKVIKQGYDGIILRKDGEIQEALIYDTNNIKKIAGEVPLTGTSARATNKTSKNLQDIISDEKKLDEFKDQYKKQYGVSQKQKQKPEVKEAVEKRLAGEITGKEQRDITKKFLPLEPITKMVKVPTFEDIAGSLTKDKTLSKGIINLNTQLKAGQRVSSRLDIPAYENFDTWVVSFHDGTKQGGKSIGYGKTANLKNVDFSSSAKAASNIAKEKTAKSTIARMYGDYNKVPDEDVVARAERILAGKVKDSNKYIDPEDGSEWIQVGMNPYRASYFVDKNTGTPLKSAEEMIQVGPLVFAKGSQRLKPSDFKKDKSLTTRTDAGKTIPFKKGGSIVERNPYNYTAKAI